MTNTAVDLWPADFGETEIVPPIAILRQQATLLGNKTKNLIEGQVSTQAETPTVVNIPLATEFRHYFDLVAPALGGYKYRLFSIVHSIEMYPVRIINGKGEIECNTEEEFVQALKGIFASEETRRAISSLLALSKA